MSDPRVDFIRRLARRSSSPALIRSLEKSRAEDIAAALSHLAPGNQRIIWEGISDDDEKAAEVLACVDPIEISSLVRFIEFSLLVRLLQLMEVDDEADVISYLPEELQTNVLAAIQEQERTQVEDLLAFPEDSAGGLMHLDMLRMNEDNSCRDAIANMQTSSNIEMAFYLYIENDSKQLVGVASIRALLTHPPSTPLKEIMITDLITVTPETEQEDVAKLVSRYDLLALPVVDHNRELMGIITVDDVLDVIQDMATRNMMLMAGVNEEHNPTERNVLRAYQQRFTWLMVTLFGGIGMAELIGSFEHTLEKQAVLAGFIPVMLGTGGNVGTQAATIAVRNLATGHLGNQNTMAMLFREAKVGTLLGISFSIVLGAYALARWWDQPMLAVAVAISITATVICAAILGMLVPLTLDRMRIDPAVATGPFVTTGIDLMAILVYFTTCGMIIK
jgi:magnesium transporter